MMPVRLKIGHSSLENIETVIRNTSVTSPLRGLLGDEGGGRKM